MLRRLVRSFTHGNQKSTITKDNLFDTIPTDCDLECHSCTIKYPANFKIEEGSDLWQTGDDWATHLIVATGKSDWVRDVSDEKGSIMEAISKAKKPTNGKLKVSASNMCPPPEYYTESSKPTTCVILPSWTQVEMVTPDDVQELVDKFISPGPTTTTPLEPQALQRCATREAKHDSAVTATPEQHDEETDNMQSMADDSTSDDGTTRSEELATLTISATSCPTAADLAASSYLKSYECPHDYLILLCSHKHRDARCGQSAPLIAKELRRHLQPLGLYRDLDDYRPGGVGIFFINHVGGHKWSANMIIYRKKAGQGIWLARVRPHDVEAIVKWTVLEGKVQPDKIRAGFDRSRGVTSW
ncbi:hypothetical protein TWF718_008027 [Orbilia javanica]|uniref:Uncharacterized protein n=1 Tax=Orbilia javanica TaxID=47235 RepID=A0AAN8N4A9_9PEZI